jgi:zinc transporter 1/2/3
MLSVGHISHRMHVFSLLHSSAPNRREHIDVSTSYVDRLQSYSSPSSSISPSPRDESPVDLECAQALPKFTNTEHSNPERTPLIGTTDSRHTLNDAHGPDSSYGAVHCTHDHVDSNASVFFESHHRHESRSLHLSHHERNRPATMYGPAEYAQGRPSGAGHVHNSESDHYHRDGFEGAENFTNTHEHHHSHRNYHHDGREGKIKVGKKRQIVGILVRLNLGLIDWFTTGTHAGQGITIRYHDPFIDYRSYPVDNIGSGLQCVIVDLPSRPLLNR